MEKKCLSSSCGKVAAGTVLFLVLAFFILSAFAAPVAGADPNLARNLAATCSTCHGNSGISNNAGIESLAGVKREVLVRKFKEFRNGFRPATVMHQISKGYDDRQIELIAAWFAARQ